MKMLFRTAFHLTKTAEWQDQLIIYATPKRQTVLRKTERLFERRTSIRKWLKLPHCSKNPAWRRELFPHGRKTPIAEWITPRLLKVSSMETKITPSRHEGSVKETGLSITIHNSANSLLEDCYDYLNKTILSLKTLQFSMENDHLKYFIDKLLGLEKTSKETLYQIFWYGYNPTNDSLKPETNKPT